MKKIYILFYFFLISSLTMKGQSVLSGEVVNEFSEPLSEVNIYIQELNKGTFTDATGTFRFESLSDDTYTLVISAIGFQTLKQQIKLSGNKTLVITLEDGVTQLQNVEITGRKERSYKNTNTFVGSKTEIAIKDLPQSVSYATKELISDQAGIRLNDVLKNFSGVNQNSFYDDVVIRGFRINGSRNTQLVNGMRTSTGFWKQSLVNYLERVEVLKGPASAISGNASPGGVINRVTKKPLREKRNSISFSTGSFNTLRALGDFTGPLTKDGKLLYRLNIGYEDAGSFRDLQFNKNVVLAPSFSFIPSDKTQINLDLIYNSSKSRLDRGQAVFKGDLYSSPTTLALSSSNDYLDEETYIITTSLNHQFTENLSFSGKFMRTGYNEDLLEHRTANGYGRDANGEEMEDKVAMQVLDRKRKRYIDNLSAFFNYKLKLAANFQQDFTLGYDYAQQEMPAGGSQLKANGYLSADRRSILQIKKPEDFLNNKDQFLLDENGAPVPNVAHFDLSNPVASQQLKNVNNYLYQPARQYGPSLYYSHAGYIQDLITYNRFKVLLGLRYERFTNVENYESADEENVTQDAWIPRVGLTYTVNNNINVYGTYVEGYQPQTAANMDPNLGGPFDPLKSNMVEFGSKSSWFNDKLSATVAVYKIKQKNTLYNQGNTDVLQQIGEEVSKGIEVDINGKLSHFWSVSASYAYNESNITKDANGMESDLQKPNTPHHQGNIWTRYTLQNGVFKGLGIGAGANYMTSRILQSNSEQTIPGYTRVDAALYYKIDKFTLQLNMKNIADKDYWVGGYSYTRLFPGEPRNWLLTLKYDF